MKILVLHTEKKIGNHDFPTSIFRDNNEYEMNILLHATMTIRYSCLRFIYINIIRICETFRYNHNFNFKKKSNIELTLDVRFAKNYVTRVHKQYKQIVFLVCKTTK